MEKNWEIGGKGGGRGERREKGGFIRSPVD